jgi:ribosomal protein L11 methyltransferase
MGTGTGILAIAAAKSWRRKVVARDIDAEAVRVARINAGRNGVAAVLRLRRSAGYRDRLVTRGAPYDLIFANILARPLAAMAKDLRRVLAPGGVAVLSGLLARQEAYVLAAHRRQAMFLVRRIAIEGWHTLVLACRAPPCAPTRE